MIPMVLPLDTSSSTAECNARPFQEPQIRHRRSKCAHRQTEDNGQSPISIARLKAHRKEDTTRKRCVRQGVTATIEAAVFHGDAVLPTTWYRTHSSNVSSTYVSLLSLTMDADVPLASDAQTSSVIRDSNLPLQYYYVKVRFGQSSQENGYPV